MVSSQSLMTSSTTAAQKPSSRRGAWILYALLVFGISTLPMTLLPTLLVILVAGPAYFCAVAVVGALSAWQSNSQAAAARGVLKFAARGGLKVFWRSILLSLPIFAVLPVQLHLIKATENPASAVFAWPQSPPSSAIVALLIAYLPLALYLAVRNLVSRNDERLDLPSATSQRLLAFAAILIFSAIGIAQAALGKSTIHALLWPIDGIQGYARKIERLWAYYDQSVPWRIGATFLIGENWNAQVLWASFRLGDYNAVRLTPRAVKTQGSESEVSEALALSVESIVIHSNPAYGRVGIQADEVGTLQCISEKFAGLDECRSAAVPLPTSGPDVYRADIVGAEWARNPATGAVVSKQELQALLESATYFVSRDPVRPFVALCFAETCQWIFTYSASDAASGVDVQFAMPSLSAWRELTLAVNEILTHSHEQAQVAHGMVNQ